MTLDGVMIYVPDIVATVRFYEQIFGFAVRSIDEEQGFAEMDTGAMTLSFAIEAAAAADGRVIRPNRPTGEAAAIQLTLVTNAIEDVFERVVAAGGTIVNPPTLKPWGQTLGVVRDNNGVLVEIATRQPENWS